MTWSSRTWSSSPSSFATRCRRCPVACAVTRSAAGTTTPPTSSTGSRPRTPEGRPGVSARPPLAMSRYVIRRVLVAVPVIFGISLVLFTILALAPGDPFEELATNPNVPPEVRQNLRAKFGLDDPLPVRYARWLGAMLHGDWGFSFVSRVDVDTLILQRLPTSLFVLGSAQLLGLLIALPIGTYSALRPYSLFDQITTTLAFIGFSLPTFFTGLIFILVFSLWLDWLPFIYRADIAATGWRWWWEHARQAAMPVPCSGSSRAPPSRASSARRCSTSSGSTTS